MMPQSPASSRPGDHRASEALGSDPAGITAFLAKFRAAIIVLSGEGEGIEHVLDQPRILIGRGPGVDLALEEPSLERVHAALEFDGTAYRLQQLGERADPPVKGRERSDQSIELKHEDRFRIGQVTFAYVLEPRTFPSP